MSLLYLVFLYFTKEFKIFWSREKHHQFEENVYAMNAFYNPSLLQNTCVFYFQFWETEKEKVRDRNHELSPEAAERI